MTTKTPDAPAAPVDETRTRALDDTDARLVRAAGDEAGKRFTGHAAVFNSRTTIGDPMRWGFYEEIDPGAFADTLVNDDQRFLVDHDTRMVIARVSSDDLRLSTDGVGLAVDADLDEEVSYVRDLVRNLEKRHITGMSFGFRVLADEWSEVEIDVTDDQGRTSTTTAELRRLTKLQLFEVSAVTFPAYEDTDAGLRSQVSEIRAARGRPQEAPLARTDTTAAARTAANLRRRSDVMAVQYRLPRRQP